MPKSVFSEDYNRFRQLLIEARKAAKLTQTELSAKLELPQSYVSKYERGERRLDVIEFLQVAQVLEIDPLAFIKELLKYQKET
ncbi:MULTISPECIES: helix-turn-helix domain-containing protein [unclassified Nostoc]|uniref:helix-turn-helix domain-containing protein n=1 Tax=unclassified Nostoc TaxID=2593658 RepID=UPI000C04EE7A|nr:MULTISPECIES: helix-turn-helix transcriptional regulator [unclassified Nostoc]PHM06875.1 transcriptional regulator [Nostoc sp. 'Peltigera malacea cyanobiont' DB3992]MBN3889311.1 helix-turn-helix transcriptional regulator [Nostoc sp. JL31]MDZ7968392.1 helix-turn-helix transcriptional regulator [Nostoc sp. DedSLP03]MDZ8031250.1 helix-turn-helix transcriptional regulator [Nostoc sp. DedSLP04]MDZ8132615.1 helix-turn-helix transcriptional regulator [Nostoc sp. DedQUE07]